MKKFLTVLLVIAVMFTFSFGSAFAATPDTSNSGQYVLSEAKVLEKINEAYGLAQKDLDETLSDALDLIFTTPGKTTATVDDVEVEKADVEKVYKENVYDAANAKLATEKQKVINAVAEAINAVGAADYNGNFVIMDSSWSAEDQAAWKKAGYATYNAAWAEKDTYYTTAISNDVTVEKYKAIFKKDGDFGTKAADVAKAAFERVKDTAEKAIQAVELSAYSTAYNGEAKSNYDKAADTVAAALRKIGEAAPTAATPAWGDYKTSIGTVNTIYAEPVNQGNPGGYVYTWAKDTTVHFADGTTATVTGLDNISKIADEPTEATKLEYAQNKVLGEVVKKINDWKSKTISDANEDILEETLKTKPSQKVIDDAKKLIADTEEQAAAAIEIVTYLVKDCDDIDDLLSAGEKLTARAVDTNKWNFKDNSGYELVAAGKTYKAVPVADVELTPVPNDVMDIVNHIKELKEDAELAKLTIQIDGTTLVEIETALEKAIDDTYYGAYGVLKVGDAVSALYNRQNELIDNTKGTVKVNDREYKEVVSWVDAALSGYDEDYYDAVRNVIDETKDAIKATKTIAEADAAFLAGLEKLDAVPTKADKNAAQSTKEFKDLAKTYKEELAAYAGYKEKIIKSSDYSWTKGTMVGKLQSKLDEAYTVDALKEAYAAAKAEIDNLKTKAELQAAAKELTDKINALPNAATVADKETVTALRDAVDAHNKYCDLIGDTSNSKITLMSKLTGAETAIKTAEKKAMKDAYDAIYKDGKVTTDEKAAVEDLRTAYDAYVNGYAGENAAPSVYTALEGELSAAGIDIDKAEADLATALVKEVKEMIAKLPADGSDVAAVKAARAAYEALDRDSKMAVYKSTIYSKLVDAEKMLAASVEALKLTASSKATKGAITVTWTVKGNKAAADGYQVWKSTKKNSGFKKAFTTTKTTYKNTKGLKKGVKYYYKVRAYKVVDGKNVYSDWSNKAYRTAQ